MTTDSFDNLIKRLEEKGSTGLDLSPGDEDCSQAATELRLARARILELETTIQEAKKNVATVLQEHKESFKTMHDIAEENRVRAEAAEKLLSSCCASYSEDYSAFTISLVVIANDLPSGDIRVNKARTALCDAAATIEKMLKKNLPYAGADYLKATVNFEGGDADNFSNLVLNGLTILDKSTREFGREMEVIPSTISRWISGAAKPLPGMKKLAIEKLRKSVIQKLELQTSKEVWALEQKLGKIWDLLAPHGLYDESEIEHVLTMHTKEVDVYYRSLASSVMKVMELFQAEE